jgi:hypothetical protein
VLTALRQNGVDVKPTAGTNGSQSLTLRWPDNSFEFDFAVLDYVQPEQNQHAYILRGFDKDWTAAGSCGYGKYTNLPGGTYTLLFRGSNNDGVWNEIGSAITVIVLPPF